MESKCRLGIAITGDAKCKLFLTVLRYEHVSRRCHIDPRLSAEKSINPTDKSGDIFHIFFPFSSPSFAFSFSFLSDFLYIQGVPQIADDRSGNDFFI